jgi:hypothetical protein
VTPVGVATERRAPISRGSFVSQLGGSAVLRQAQDDSAQGHDDIGAGDPRGRLEVFGVDALGFVLGSGGGGWDGYFGVVFAFVVDRVLLHPLAFVGAEHLR